jgi:hypothetical protein
VEESQGLSRKLIFKKIKLYTITVGQCFYGERNRQGTGCNDREGGIGSGEV